jgi:ankyrin repeat protein
MAADAPKPSGIILIPPEFNVFTNPATTVADLNRKPIHAKHALKRSVRGFNALHALSGGGNASLVSTLVRDWGLNVNLAENEDQYTPVHTAIAAHNPARGCDNIPLIRALCAAGASLSALNQKGATPLDLAMIRERMDIVRILVDYPGVTSFTNSQGQTPLMRALSLDKPHFALFISRLPSVDVNAIEPREDYSPLNDAAETGQVDVMQVLIERKADLEHATKEGMTPLSCAIHGNHRDAVALLLESKANPNYMPKTGILRNSAPLHQAVSNKAIVRLLIKARANADAIDNNGATALTLAIHRGHSETAKYLRTRTSISNVCELPGGGRASAATITSHTELGQSMRCGNPECVLVGKSKCGTCRSVYYCGSECQRAHWKQHKKVCKQLATSGPHEQPDPAPSNDNNTL